MKRLFLLAIVCIVVDQLKHKTGWLTKCEGIELEGEVVLAKQIVRGQAVTYRPYIVDGDDYIYGEILGINDAPKTQPATKGVPDEH